MGQKALILYSIENAKEAKSYVTCSLTDCRKSTQVSILFSPICILGVQLTKFMWYLHVVKYANICKYV